MLSKYSENNRRMVDGHGIAHAVVCRSLVFILMIASLASPAALYAEEAPRFFRGLNLNGPAVQIDGYEWEGQDSTHYACQDKAFDNQNVSLVPETDADRAKMIRSSRWGGNRLELTDIPPGLYTLFLYVWEDNNSETYSIDLNGQRVLTNYKSGSTGHWERLGPWHTQVRSDRKIILTSQGGAANWSGVEIWSGRYDGLGETLSEEQLAFFEKRIRPLLVNQCYECHSAESDDLGGELLLDSRATLRRGGTNGPAVVPGDTTRSLLIEAVHYGNENLQMPPDGKLSDAEIRDLEQWVKMGAPDPRSTATKHLGKQIDIAAAREFWSLRPIADSPVPVVKNSNWSANDIDRFVLAKQEEHGLEPAPDADKRTLIRRATYDLTGLPPTPEEVAAFLADKSPQAFNRVVDRLLDSPRYGERWGRHWLDVVRYADTAGDNSDYPIPQIYRYRDWVIDAFNRDLPYDEFVRDQLAGDLRGGTTDEERNARVIATGYLANARRFGSRVDDYPWHLTIEDTIDNLGKTFLGTSLGCTRCHDHKFDPFTTRDYYGLYGIFSSTRYPWPGIELDKRQREFVALVAPDERAKVEQAQASWNKEQSQLDDEVKKLKDALKKAPEAEKKEAEEKLRDAERRTSRHRQQKPLFEAAYAVIDAATRGEAAVQIKGDPARLGDIVPRHFPAVLGGSELPANSNASGRAELAEWLVSDANPLPARVMVNRIWQHHFGRGIVPTPNDFGKQGKPPTHPELLDWLAVRFRESGWSVKSMHRLILLSRTYRQSSVRAPRSLETDPSNDWLAGYPRRRLDAEAIRDTLLALGGNLDLSPAGPHPFPEQRTWDFTQHKPFKALYETNRRSVFLMTQRIQRHPFLAIFDGADPSTSTATRMTSTTPLQALYLLNDPFVHTQSELVSRRVQSHVDDDAGRVKYAYELILSRPPFDAEIKEAQTFLKDAGELLQRSGTSKEQSEPLAWDAYIRTLLRLNDFVYLD
ncbi:MAG: PSD1 and planctomycete cytochrome C domain-containing protein [Planctomycetaceae bacterium]